MANCPRCGAENQPGRASCWNCWEILPSTPEEEIPAESPVSPDSEQVFPNAPFPISDEVVPPEPLTIPPAMPRSGPTVWVGDESAAETEHEVSVHHSGGWARIIIVALAMILLGIILLWHYTFRPKAPVTAVSDVAQAYVAALAVRDTQTQQQLATEDSKGLLLPGWITVASGFVRQPASEQGKSASIGVDFILSPAPLREPLPSDVVGALSRRYNIPLRLQLESDGWRVDQQVFLQALKKALAEENPKVAFPKWN